MASTNKTTNILLSQFLGTDHFSFLSDYNGDMLKIDTYCGNLKALIDGASSKTEQNTESIQTVKSDIQSIQAVQERQNNNITKNTEDITKLKETTAKNTDDINKLIAGKGKVLNIPILSTNLNGVVSFPSVRYNTADRKFYVGGAYQYSATTILNGFSGNATLDITNVPDEVRTVIAQQSFSGEVGTLSYRAVQTIDGNEYSFDYFVPLIGEIVSDDGNYSRVILSISPKLTLPTIDGTVITSARYALGGGISLGTRLA
jgi:hypothetical protein